MLRSFDRNYFVSAFQYIIIIYTIPYAIGCLLHYIVQRHQNVFSKFFDIKIYVILLLAISFLSLNVNNLLILSDNLSISIQSIGAFLLIAYLVCSSRKYSGKVFSLFVALGGFSYELYLIHFPILLVFRSFSLPYPLFVIVTLLVSIFSAYLSHHFIKIRKICQIHILQ